MVENSAQGAPSQNAAKSLQLLNFQLSRPSQGIQGGVSTGPSKEGALEHLLFSLASKATTESRFSRVPDSTPTANESSRTHVLTNDRQIVPVTSIAAAVVEDGDDAARQHAPRREVKIRTMDPSHQRFIAPNSDETQFSSRNLALGRKDLAAHHFEDGENGRCAPEIVDNGEEFILEKLGPEQMQKITRAVAKFDELTTEFSCAIGKQESRRERNEKGYKEISLTYGEIEFTSFCKVFRWIQQTYKDNDPQCWHNAFNIPGGTFVDLGHGTGKGILAGTFMHQFQRCWGIEILEGLQAVSLNMKSVYDDWVQNVAPAEYEEILGWPSSAAPLFEAVQGDMYQHAWYEADMIFANSTCFTIPMMERIYQQSLKCKRGTWFVTMSKRLPHSERIKEGADSDHIHWEFILAIKLEMSWGKATVNLQRKISLPVQ